VLFTNAIESLDTVLRRRGQLIVRTGSLAETLLPPWFITPGLEHQTDQLVEFRRHFGRTSFRKVARALTAARGAAVPLGTLRGIAGDKAPEYVRFLAWLGAATQLGDDVRLTRPIDNIGPTLEWYVADLCEHELCGNAAWAVRLEGLKVGGDYDVLAWLAPTLVYIECQTSASAAISVEDFRQFRRRDRALAPELSIMLIDSDDDLADLLARLTDGLCEEVRQHSGIGDPAWRPERPFVHPVPHYPGVNWGFRHLYVVTSGESIPTRLRRCLQHYHAEIKRYSFLA